MEENECRLLNVDFYCNWTSLPYGRAFCFGEITSQKKTYFIPKRVPSPCQISTYCTSGDKWYKTTAKQYKTIIFHQSESSWFLQFPQTVAWPFKKDLCLHVYKSMTEQKVMHIQRLDNMLSLNWYRSSYCMHTLNNLQLELTPNQPVRLDKDQQGN